MFFKTGVCRSAPFSYFVDQKEEIARSSPKGERSSCAFRVLATPRCKARLPDPGNPMTFVNLSSITNERRLHGKYALHRDLLRIRREDSTSTVSARRGRRSGCWGRIVCAPFFAEARKRTLLLVNLGRHLLLEPVPEPLLAPPQGASWAVMWAAKTLAMEVRWPIGQLGCWHIQG